jgi:hypothetical protein
LEGKKRLSVEGNSSYVEPHKGSYQKLNVSKFQIVDNRSDSNTLVGENK